MKRLALLVLAVLSIAFGSATASSDAKAANSGCFDAWMGGVGSTPALTEFCYQGRVWVSSSLLFDQYQTHAYMGTVYGTLRKYWGQNSSGQWNSVCVTYNQLWKNWVQVSCPF